MSYTYQGKTLNNLYSYAIQNYQKQLNNPTDNSGNPLRVGDKVLYISGVKYARPSYVELIEIIPDGTQDRYLGFKLKNGQYTITYNHNLYKVTPDFVKLHPKL